MADRWWGQRSEYVWEQEALDHVKAQMPDRDPYRAWQCFSFTANSGQIRECDLFVVTSVGAFLVEIKSHPGRATNHGGTWFFDGEDRRRTIDNPLHLTRLKALQLKTQLEWAARKLKIRDYRSPFFEAAVFLSAPDLRCAFDEVQVQHVYGRDGLDGQTGLPGIWNGLLNKPRGKERPDPVFLRNVSRLMQEIGAQAIARDLKFGAYTLDSRAFGSGPTWTDYLGQHEVLKSKQSRVRVYHYGEAGSEAARESIKRAADREFRSLDGIAHEGIVKAEHYDVIDGRGPAIAFSHRRNWQRLDHFMQEKGADLDVSTQVEMVRQLAEAVNHAHRNRLFHRALAARSVWVEMDGSYPRLRIADWQVASRQGSAFSSGGHTTHQVTRHLGARVLADHVEAAAQAYLAPEFPAFDGDPRALDMFGLGALAYLVFSGRPPGQDRHEVSEQIREHGELTPASVNDDVTPIMDTLVREATRREPGERTRSPRDFLRRIDEVEEHLTRPDAVTDPLTAVRGQEVIDGWTVKSVLGKGATSRALLVERDGAERVFKVAVNQTGAVQKLSAEAAQLKELRNHRIVAIVDDGLLTVGEHTVLQLELAGEHTLADYLHIGGSLGVEELHRFGVHLFEVVDYLEDRKVFHRDIKPANVGVRERRKKGRALVLFDFSLAGADPADTRAGTPGYLDPFLELDEPKRVYDAAAERYALAVTLHEMASGELPVWHEDGVDLRFLPADLELPRLREESFPDQLRRPLTAFFKQALHRRPERRFDTLEGMRDAWEQVFRTPAERPVTTPDSAGAVPLDDEATRLRNAETATAETPLYLAGLTPNALDAATRVLRCETVGDLLTRPAADLRRVRGVSYQVRNELAAQVNRWRRRLEVAEPVDSSVTVRLPQGGGEEARNLAKRQANLDKVIRQFIPKSTEQNRAWVRVTRELLGLPEDAAARPVWPTQREVAERLGLDQVYVSQQLAKARRHWKKSDLLTAVRDDVVAILERHGRLREVRQIAEELLSMRGSTLEVSDTRRAHALAAVRAVAECEEREDSPGFALRRVHGSAGVLVAQVIDDDPGVPVEADLLDYAVALGRTADRLVDFGDDAPLPSPGDVRAVLREVPVEEGMAPLSDVDLVTVAAAASERARVTARLELYPESLGFDRALDLTQAVSYLGDPGITPQQIRDRVKARFPELGIPGEAELWALLHRRYPRLERRADPDGVEYWSLPAVLSRTSTGTLTQLGGGPAAAPAEQRAAGRRLDQSALRGGYLAVKTWLGDAERVAARLGARPDVAAIDVSAEFVSILTGMIEEFGGPPWSMVVDADRPGGPVEFAAMVAEACENLGGRVRSAGADRPVLLYNATPLGRYPAGRTLLRALSQEARDSGAAPYGLWVLCPMRSPQGPATLDGASAETIIESEQLELPRGFGAEMALAG
ncbi:BREX system serine/threonine kinase PglW [Actinorugispora endophytica]|uniref:non-specific serine/threonine protein kinase n=1 Tax=Actinorugispora endophytica TaxID=1605990 RepID=A0A4V3D8Y8_9ACTN|nr:BREX system serine/threonine kinase PglW [Actinorugispora endophytica]TDQ53750.1 serine/threonine protein kinase [Actinorugispora endophytica]